ncbi:MAG: sarcosine oxidase subunit alpha family protein, partial [Pseudomonadota bacterium]
MPLAAHINRARPLRFTFDGRQYIAYEGDTLASALVASGTRLVARSFKYHRPRGIFTAGPEEPNALVELRDGARREPNTRATTTEVFDGLIARSQNAWPSLRYDMLGVNQIAAPMFAAGFYYKTFMWPAKAWETLYEPAIRRAAGLGRAAQEPDPDTYEKVWAHCDVLVVGGGASGLAAALSAGRSGARVIVCDDDFRLGGRLLSETSEINDDAAAAWVSRAVSELQSLPEVTLLPRTSVTGVYDGGTYSALERVSDHRFVSPSTNTADQPRHRMWRIVAKRAVIAAGAIERPIVFAGNDRPGVMLASAARTYINRFAATPGTTIAVFTNNDDGWRTAADAEAAGVTVAAVIDIRDADASPAPTAINGELVRGVVTEANATKDGVSSVTVRGHNGSSHTFRCDAVAVSGGWNPNVALTCHKRGRPEWRDEIAAFVPSGHSSDLMPVGAAAGDFGLGACLSSGHRAGVNAASAAGFGHSGGDQPKATNEPSDVTAFWHVSSELAPSVKGKAFVDLQHDVTRNDIALAHLEGFRSVEHLKRYTTLGMATDQGRLSNVLGLALMAEARGTSIAEQGTTMFRPPYAPTAIGAIAGRHRDRHYRPVRRTPTHDWAVGQAASFVDAGLWKRAEWYVRDGETHWRQSVDREVKTVRDAVGFCDVSTLGKLDVVGPDAGKFLDRVYTNLMSTLAVGKCRYGLMLRDDGFVFDDGTAARLSDTHYVITTTTANAGAVTQHLDHASQVLWPDLAVNITSSTDQWAQVSIAGPHARDVLARLVGSAADVSNDGLPFMGQTTALLADGGPVARIYRISFSGELAYEVGVPANYGHALAGRLMVLGADYGIAPYGTEALNILRLEKGHVSGGELNGMTTARDLGLGGMMSAKKDFIGRTLSYRAALIADDRPVLVGLKPSDPADAFRAGEHIFAKDCEIGPDTDDGGVR